MKTKITLIIIVGSLALAFFARAYMNSQGPTVYEAPKVEVATSTPIELSKVEEAQAKLDAAKVLLDEEEKTILAEIATNELRLEDIRKVRLSFSQAPNQPK